MARILVQRAVQLCLVDCGQARLGIGCDAQLGQITLDANFRPVEHVADVALRSKPGACRLPTAFQDAAFVDGGRETVHARIIGFHKVREFGLDVGFGAVGSQAGKLARGALLGNQAVAHFAQLGKLRLERHFHPVQHRHHVLTRPAEPACGVKRGGRGRRRQFIAAQGCAELVDQVAEGGHGGQRISGTGLGAAVERGVAQPVRKARVTGGPPQRVELPAGGWLVK